MLRLGFPRPLLPRPLRAAAYAIGLMLAAQAGLVLWAARPARLDITARDIDGHFHPAAEPGARATVWVFVAHDCPLCNGYAPLLTRLSAEYASRGVRWNIVYAEPELSVASLRDHAKTYALAFPLLSDPELQLARDFGISITPEVAVIDEHSALVYRGRIDDQYPEPGVRRTQARSHDLRDAIEAVLAGRLVAHPRTAAVGCTLEVPAGAAPPGSMKQ